MEQLIFGLPGNEKRAASLAKGLNAALGEVEIRSFPDGETYVRVLSEVENKNCILICTLDRPDSKLLPLYFLARTITALGGTCTCLVAPYLAYMRQDIQFKRGEGVTSEYFAELVSQFANSLITVDPHLHRRGSLNGIYHIPTKVIHAAYSISTWIKDEIDDPVLVGPDIESEQWVSVVAEDAGAPYIILRKERHGDRFVDITVPRVKSFIHHTPVLVDDIISTGQTMIETAKRLKEAGMNAPVCIGVHAVFAGDAYCDMQASDIDRVVTCDTIPHPTNEIELDQLFLEIIGDDFCS